MFVLFIINLNIKHKHDSLYYQKTINIINDREDWASSELEDNETITIIKSD